MIFTEAEMLEANSLDRNGISLEEHRWPGDSEVKGKMPYVFDGSHGSNEEKFFERVTKRFNIDLAGCLKIV